MKKIFTALSVMLSSAAFAQTPCDSLTIDAHYYPFSDSLIQVHVINSNTGSFFSYPQFTILDANSDTVAHEQVNFFGIGQESFHVPEVYPGMPATNTFAGTLQLYYITVDSYAVCTWNMNFDLCPDTCTPFYPHFENIGGQQVLGTANWEFLNSSQQVVANGSFVLDANNQAASDTVCLGAGNYTYKVTNVSMNPGGQKWTGVWGENMYVQGPQVAFNDPVETIALELYEACQTTTNVKENMTKTENVKVWSADSKIYIKNTANAAIGDVAVYSVDGRLIVKEQIAESSTIIEMNAYPTSIYIVKTVNSMSKVVSGK